MQTGSIGSNEFIVHVDEGPDVTRAVRLKLLEFHVEGLHVR